MFELMCVTKFFTGAHNVVINGFKNNWYETMKISL
jgi:hypothetical protein